MATKFGFVMIDVDVFPLWCGRNQLGVEQMVQLSAVHLLCYLSDTRSIVGDAPQQHTHVAGGGREHNLIGDKWRAGCDFLHRLNLFAKPLGKDKLSRIPVDFDVWLAVDDFLFEVLPKAADHG